jgi:hypothetical protein
VLAVPACLSSEHNASYIIISHYIATMTSSCHRLQAMKDSLMHARAPSILSACNSQSVSTYSSWLVWFWKEPRSAMARQPPQFLVKSRANAVYLNIMLATSLASQVYQLVIDLNATMLEIRLEMIMPSMLSRCKFVNNLESKW